MNDYKHLTEEQIAIFAEAIGLGKENTLPEEWRNHVAECDQCAYEINMVSEFFEAEENIPEKGERKKNKNRAFFSRKFLIRFSTAASIIFIIGAGIFLTILFTDKAQDDLVGLNKSKTLSDSLRSEIKETDKIEKENIAENNKAKELEYKESPKPFKKKKAIEAVNGNQSAKSIGSVKNADRKFLQSAHTDKLAYVPNDQLEGLVERFKDSELRGDDVSVLTSTEVKVKSSQEIKLKFDNPNNKTLILEFFDNKGEKLFEEETTAESYSSKKLMRPGLYYWKLINEDFDLLFCSRIIVEQE